MGSGSCDLQRLGPVPHQPRQPSCDFDAPEEHPVADGMPIDGGMPESGQTSGAAAQGILAAPGPLKLLSRQPYNSTDDASTEEEEQEKEEEEQVTPRYVTGHGRPIFVPAETTLGDKGRRRSRDACRLQDAVLSLTAAVARELELHRQVVEDVLLQCDLEPLESSKPGVRGQENAVCLGLRGDARLPTAPLVKVHTSPVRAKTCDLCSHETEAKEPIVATQVRKRKSAGATLSALDFGEKHLRQFKPTLAPLVVEEDCKTALPVELPDAQVKRTFLSPSGPPLLGSASSFGDQLHKSKQDQDIKRTEMLEDYNRMKGEGRRTSKALLVLAGLSGEASEGGLESMRIGRNVILLTKMRRLMTSRPFSSAVTALILLNAVFVGIVADSTLRRAVELFSAGQTAGSLSDMSEPWQEAVEIMFTILFTVELFLRIGIFQLSFFIGPDWKWNVFDTVVVLEAIVGFILIKYNLGLSWARLFRLVRLLRSLRVMRALRYFRRLRLMLISVLGSLIPVMWAAIFLLLVLFVFSVVIADGVTDSLSRRDYAYGDSGTSVQVDQDIIYYFGNMPMVLLSHFIAVTGGISWWELGSLLSKISWAYVGVFLTYVAVMVLMVLNIITGIFVNDAIEISQTDREFAAESVLQREKAIFKELELIFHELDGNGDGLLSCEEFKDRVRLPEVKATLSALGIDVPDAVRFFRLLDIDNNGEVEIDEFVMGCMNIKGRVGTISLEAMMVENKRLLRHFFRTMPNQHVQHKGSTIW